jgi:hypothetical protein
MKTVTVECIKNFHDIADEKFSAIRVEGDSWEATENRANELVTKELVKVVTKAK